VDGRRRTRAQACWWHVEHRGWRLPPRNGRINPAIYSGVGPLLYRGVIVRGRDRVYPALLLGACVAVVASGCGGAARQDAGEHAGTFALKVVHASFPAKQSMVRQAYMTLQIRNTGAHTVPNVAVSVDSFAYTSNYPNLASDKRPVWVVEQGPGPRADPPVQSQAVSPPGGAQTAYVNTWALGPLAPRQTATFRWKVTPVKAGVHTVHFLVGASLAGKAKAQLASGGPVQGSFTADIAPRPPSRHIDPSTGRIVAGTYPAAQQY
jgi:hypothetical protein